MKARNLKGKNNPSWKGGKTKLQFRIRESVKYKEWRKAVYTRDDFKCNKCSYIGYIEAHHIKTFSSLLDENNITTFEQAISCNNLWDIDNGETLCKKCHRKTDSYGKR